MDLNVMNTSPDNRRCYNCGETGHIARDCTKDGGRGRGRGGRGRGAGSAGGRGRGRGSQPKN